MSHYYRTWQVNINNHTVKVAFIKPVTREEANELLQKILGETPFEVGQPLLWEHTRYIVNNTK